MTGLFYHPDEILILVQHRNPYPRGKVRVQLALPSEQLICYNQT
jgi:hypothetical protein